MKGNDSSDLPRRIVSKVSPAVNKGRQSIENERLAENSMAVFRGCVAERRVNDRFVFHSGSKPREQWRTRAAGILAGFEWAAPFRPIRFESIGFHNRRPIIFAPLFPKKQNPPPRRRNARETNFFVFYVNK